MKAGIKNNANWLEDLTFRLSKYKERKARLKVLEIDLEKSVGPSARVCASYGDAPGSGLGVVSDKEVEWRELHYEIKLIDAALNGLTELDRIIIELRYIEQVKDWHIYDIYIPKRLEKYISKSYYYERRREALEIMARCLGYKRK